MRNDITRVALVATEPEMVQNIVFLSPKEVGGSGGELGILYISRDGKPSRRKTFT